MRLMPTASLEIALLFFPIRSCNHASGHSRPASEVAGLCISDPPTSSWMGTSVSQMPVSWEFASFRVPDIQTSAAAASNSPIGD
jgi:hypothetical protein